MKLLFDEAESEALARWLAARSDLPKVTSQLALVEVVRVCCRLDPQAEPAARQLLGGLDLPNGARCADRDISKSGIRAQATPA